MYFAGVGMMTNLECHTAVKQRHTAVINCSHGRHHPPPGRRTRRPMTRLQRMIQHFRLFLPLENDSLFVMAGLRPGHPRLSCSSEAKTWMPGTRPGMTSFA